MSKILQIEKLNVSYGVIEALHDVSLYVDQGEIVTIIGANGAGKTTLLMSIFATPSPKSGKIIFDGNEIQGTPSHHVMQMGIALSPEGRRIFPFMTVEENLQMGCDALSFDSPDVKVKVFEMFPILKERRNQAAGTLSGGEQQMLAIGRALMAKPKVLLLDEPSLGLAPLISKRIFDSLREIIKDGVTVLLVEQNAFGALKLASRGYVLMNGRIKMEGPSEELLTNPEVKEAYLGGH